MQGWLNQLEDMAALADACGPPGREATETLMAEYHSVSRGVVTEGESRAAVARWVGAAS